MLSFKNFYFNEAWVDLKKVKPGFSIPQLKIKYTNPREIIEIIVVHYENEVKRLQEHGETVRNPAVILLNKIRHIIINYDQVKDALHDTIMSDEERLQLTEETTKEIASLCNKVINSLFPVITVPGAVVRKEELLKANERHITKELAEIEVRRQYLSRKAI